MISGIAKLYIQLHSNIYTKGFSCNGNRLGFSLKQNINWAEVPIQRDSSSDSGNVLNQATSLTVEAKTIGLIIELFKYNGKRVVCRYVSNNNDARIVGIDQPLTVAIGFNSGISLGDDYGITFKLIATCRCIPEVILPVPSATCFLRADSVELSSNKVLRLNDLSGNEYNAVIDEELGSLVASPTIVQNAINGKPAVFIHHKAMMIESDYIGNTALFCGVNSLGHSDEFTILAVVKPTSYEILSGIIVDQNFQTHIQYDPIYDINHFGYVCRGHGTSDVIFNNYDQFKLWIIKLSIDGNIKIWMNNILIYSEQITGTSKQQLDGKINIGKNNNANADQIQIAELRIWDKLLTDEQIITVGQEIMQYYGL